MVVIRCTLKLLRHVGTPADPCPCSTTRLGDWCGNLIGVGHQRLALFISEHGRLPVVLPARGLKQVATNLPAMAESVLNALGISPEIVGEEVAAMQDAAISRTNSRSLLGTLTDLQFALKWKVAEEPQMDLVELAIYLSQTPMAPLGYDPPFVAVPRLLRS